MPLIAVHQSSGRLLDATAADVDEATEPSWSTVHRARPRVALTCPGCGGAVIAKRSKNGVRFFAHHTASPDCPHSGESAEHLRLKTHLAELLRRHGWTATLEYAEPGWRTDVLGVSPDGTRRLGLEVQLAGITEDEVLARTSTMTAADLDVMWVTTRPAAWLGCTSSLRLEPFPDGYIVTEGLLTHTSRPCPGDGGCWKKGMPCPGHDELQHRPTRLAQVIAVVCAGQLAPITYPPRIAPGQSPAERTDWGHHERWARDPFTVGMVHHVHADTYAAGAETRLRYDRWVSRESERQAADWTNHLKSIDALADRQERFLPTAVRWVAAHSGRTCRVILPAPDPSSGSIVMDAIAALSTSEHPWHPRWAQGVAIGTSADEVVAVLCPVASRIDRDPGLRRRLAGVAVLATSRAEYDRLARVLPRHTVLVRLDTPQE